MIKSTMSASFTVTWWASIPSQHQRVERHPPGVCSLRPAVCIRVSSLGQILGPIRLELTESCHAAVDGLLGLLRRLCGLQVHRSTSASNDSLLACDPRGQLFALILSARVQTLDPIRLVLTESRHAAVVGLLGSVHRHGGSQVQQMISELNVKFLACAPRGQMFAFVCAV